MHVHDVFCDFSEKINKMERMDIDPTSDLEHSVNADDLEWVVYTRGETEEPFESWLQRNMPTTVCK